MKIEGNLSKLFWDTKIYEFPRDRVRAIYAKHGDILFKKDYIHIYNGKLNAWRVLNRPYSDFVVDGKLQEWGLYYYVYIERVAMLEQDYKEETGKYK